MTTLHLPPKREYFEAIRSGMKPACKQPRHH